MSGMLALSAILSAGVDQAGAAQDDDLPICGTDGRPAAELIVADLPEGLDPEVWNRLGEIESAGSGVRTLTARILVREDNDLTMATTTRTGRLTYRAARAADESAGTPAHARALGIFFETRMDGPRRQLSVRHYIFSGRWLAEIDPEQRLFVRYEIAGAGEDFDPMRLGEGPIPLPVGQPRDEVLRRFRVTMGTFPEEGPLARLAERTDLYVLALVPMEGSPESREMRRLRLVYDAAHHLPIGVEVVTADGDLRTARLDDLLVNPELDEAALAELSTDPPADRSGWIVESRGAAPR